MISAKELREQSKSLNILYAEDEAMLRDSMKTTLEKLFGNVLWRLMVKKLLRFLKKKILT